MKQHPVNQLHPIFVIDLL